MYTRLPDVLVVVLDCVSGEDFVGGQTPVDGLNASNALAREGLVYTRAVAPASWTVPSHASMFTGLYPWESGFGVDEGGGGRTRDKTLAERLRAMDFRTASFSANPHLGPRFGLNRGFEHSEWGGFSDCSIRKLTKWYSNHHTAGGDTHPGQMIGQLPKSLRKSLRYAIVDVPIGADIANRIASRVLGAGRSSESRVAPWIESSVGRWLAGLKESEASFCFVNLLDAHEAYIGLPEKLSDPEGWLDLLKFSQRARDWDGIPLHFDSGQARALRTLYRIAIKILDERLAALFEIFKNARDWENTVVIITSDHGQSFLPQRTSFHTEGGTDSVHRIPLIVKPAGRGGRVGREESWVSLSGLPSLINSAGFENHSVGRTLGVRRGGQKIWDQGAIVLSLSEELPEGDGEPGDGGGPPAHQGQSIIGYAENVKIIVQTRTLQSHMFLLKDSNREAPEPVTSLEPGALSLKEAAVRAAIETRGPKVKGDTGKVDQKLAGWGYE
jgi:hypothetical protein